MSLFKLFSYSTGALLALCAVSVQAAMNEISIQPLEPVAGEQLVFVVGANDKHTFCGFQIDFGDGEKRDVKVDTDIELFPRKIPKAYAKAGIYKVSVTGKRVTTHWPCSGEAITTVIVKESDQQAAAGTSAQPGVKTGENSMLKKLFDEMMKLDKEINNSELKNLVQEDRFTEVVSVSGLFHESIESCWLKTKDLTSCYAGNNGVIPPVLGTVNVNPTGARFESIPMTAGQNKVPSFGQAVDYIVLYPTGKDSISIVAAAINNADLNGEVIRSDGRIDESGKLTWSVNGYSTCAERPICQRIMGYNATGSFQEIEASLSSYKIAMELCIADTTNVKKCKAGTHKIPAKVGKITGNENHNGSNSQPVKGYKVLAGIDVLSDGRIIGEAINGDGLHGETLILTPTVTGGAIRWDRSGTCLNARLCRY